MEQSTQYQDTTDAGSVALVGADRPAASGYESGDSAVEGPGAAPKPTFLDRNAVLALAKRPADIRRVDLHAAPGSFVFLREMTSAQRDKWESSLIKERKGKREMTTEHIRAKLLIEVLCDEAGVLQFGPADVLAVSGIPSSIADEIYDAALRHNGITKEDTEELKGN